jgi:hypothetical protein
MVFCVQDSNPFLFAYLKSTVIANEWYTANFSTHERLEWEEKLDVYLLVAPLSLNTSPRSLSNPAVFSMFVEISSEEFWLTPSTVWLNGGPNGSVRRFKDVQMTFVGTAPSSDSLGNDFMLAYNKLARLQRHKVRSLNSVDEFKAGLVFTHQPYQVRSVNRTLVYAP